MEAQPGNAKRLRKDNRGREEVKLMKRCCRSEVRQVTGQTRQITGVIRGGGQGEANEGQLRDSRHRRRGARESYGKAVSTGVALRTAARSVGRTLGRTKEYDRVDAWLFCFRADRARQGARIVQRGESVFWRRQASKGQKF
ncbi:hypothetical protein TRVL_07716 [Trypanosoma vivax]|nr:hypothetical protein TRVL_07716 [Trypanosoma vivax]